MRIERVRTWVVRMPWDGGGDAVVTRGGSTLPGTDYFVRPENGCVYSRSLQSVLVKVETDQGLSGWGEAQAPVVPAATEAVVKDLLGPLVLGDDPRERRVIWTKMARSMATRGHGGGIVRDAMAAVDIACWDIAARAAGVPVATLLGGAFRQELAAYVSGVPGDDVALRVETVQRLIAEGFAHFKLTLGYGVDEDLAEVATLRSAAGPTAGIYADAHWRYTAEEAIRLGQGLARYGVGFLEAPVPSELERSQRRVAAHAGLPVALGEEYRSVHEFHRRLLAGAIGVAQPDVGRCGLTGASEIAALCERFGVPVAPHVGVGLGVYVAAALQLAAALPNFYLMECDPEPGLAFANRILREPLRLARGAYLLPAGPGLGVEVDESAVAGWCVA